jgi:hypothetical protein
MKAKLVVTETEAGGEITVETPKHMPRMVHSDTCPCFPCKMARAAKELKDVHQS